MADLDIQSYEPVEATSELLNRPDQMYLVGGQAAFLSLCVNQRIPIVNSTRNVSTMFTPTPFGQGASSTVLAFASDLSITPRRDFINPSLDGWFGPAGSSTNVSLRYVAKRVNAHSAATSDDPKSLAAITNEVRILSNSGIRSTPNIVSLLAVSWFEGPSHGRFWPQLYLERADLGTLENYLSSNSVSKLIKFMLYRNILAGLQCLHLNDVVSCDLKPQNILVFNSRHAGERGATEEEIQFMPVVAKLCDFGFAVILSDYRSKRPFQARIGTWPWMSPELDLSIPTQGDLLHKSDIYSSGLLLASIVENGKTPFRGMTVSQIRAAKRNISACDIILSEIRSGTNLTRTERARISIILVETLAPFPQQRVALKTLAAQWNVAIEEILQGESSSRRKNLRALFHSRYPTVLLISPMPIPALGNGPKLVVPNSQPEPGTAGWAHSGDDPRQEAVPIVPDFCFEFNFLPGTLPRVAIKEVTADLLEQSNLQGSSRRDVLYALSGSYLNDSVIQYDAERGLQHLSKAAAEGHEDALFMKRDVFEAATGIPHPEFKDEIAETICEAAKMQMATSIIVMSYLKLQDFKQHHWQFSKCYSWRRHFPVEYKEYTYSAERARYMAVALQTCLDTDSNQEAWITDSESESSTSLEETSKFLFTTDWFDAPVMDGLTRLQTVAILEPLFEADLASYLVEKSGADLNACGTMPGWTPLWLSILCGHSRTTQYLLRNGASLTYVGPGSAGSVLHILNQLDASEAPAVLTNILAANDADKQSDLELRVGGLTPLQATFVGWDFSDGAAARALLDEGANPTSRAGLEQGNVTPIALCMRSLNYKLLSNMLASRWVLDNNNQPAARTALASAKASAFTTLLNHTKFYYMSVLGRDFEQSLTNCLKLLIDDDMKIQLGLRNTDPNVPGDPLATALYTSRAYVAEALLREFPLTAFVSAAFSRPYIQIAIKRRLRKCVMSLISKGANLLQKGMDNSTSLHAAAQYFPEILLDLIEILDEIPLSRRQGMTMKEILVMKNIDGFDVVSLLLLEGHREELNIVEQLRTQYALDLYSFRYAVGESQCTLAGICTLMTARTGLVSLSQLEYLLKLEPPPSFVCSDDGSTLLTLAALSGPSGTSKSAIVPAHQALRMTFDYYPDLSNISQGPRGRSTLFLAALNGRRTAIELIEMHIKRHTLLVPGEFNRVFFDMLNTPSSEKTCVLDAAAAYVQEVVSDETMEESGKAVKRKEAIETFKYLRERGARMGHEQRGVVLSWNMVYETLQDRDSFIRGVDNICTRIADMTGFGFIPRAWEPDPLIFDHDGTEENVLDMIRADPRLDGAYCHFRVVLLIWAFDRFQLRMLNFKCSAVKLQDYLGTRFRNEMTETGIQTYLASCGHDDDVPWAKTTYTQYIPTMPAIDAIVTWTRPGRTWTNDEVMEVVQTFKKTWEDEFKGPIQETFKRGNGGFPAIFRRLNI